MDKKDAAAIAASAEFSDRDILTALLHAVAALAGRLGGGPLVIRLESAKTRHAVDVHASPDGARFVASLPEHAMPVHTALRANGT